LRQHPGVEVVARDRAGAYAEGAREGAPQAKQVADRWHLLRNLGDALQKAVERYHLALRQAARAVSQGAGAAPAETSPVAKDTNEISSRVARRARRRARYEELQRLHASGLPVREIAPALGMSAVAAYRWLKAGGPPTHDKPAQPRSLDPYVAHLEVRWREGCRNGWRLWREVRERGFTGAVNAVARWVADHRRHDPPPEAAKVRNAAVWPEPSSRRCAKLLITPPDKLDEHESKFRGHLAQMAPDLAQAGKLAIRCMTLIRSAPKAGSGPLLDTWLTDARGTALDAFARGIERDREAVLAALVEPWSTGPVEGQINRLKLLKRTMYGRAGYDLLRRRVLNAA
jgi:transposase